MKYIKKVTIGIFNFLKWNGIYAFLSIMTLYIPLWLGYLLNDQEMIDFAWRWVAIWAAPFPPAFLVLALLVYFYRWVWSVIKQGVQWLKESWQKIQIQNQLGLYFTSEEIKKFLDLGKEINKWNEQEMSKFKETMRVKRLKKIDDQWTKEVEK